MNDLLCPVCGDSINVHGRNGCYRHKAPEDKTPGTYCPCRQSAADIAEFLLITLAAEAEAHRAKYDNGANKDNAEGYKQYWAGRRDEAGHFRDRFRFVIQEIRKYETLST